MYINPFWCGVIATILVELGAIITYAIYSNDKNKEIAAPQNMMKESFEDVMKNNKEEK